MLHVTCVCVCLSREHLSHDLRSSFSWLHTDLSPLLLSCCFPHHDSPVKSECVSEYGSCSRGEDKEGKKMMQERKQNHHYHHLDLFEGGTEEEDDDDDAPFFFPSSCKDRDRETCCIFFPSLFLFLFLSLIPGCRSSLPLQRNRGEKEHHTKRGCSSWSGLLFPYSPPAFTFISLISSGRTGFLQESTTGEEAMGRMRRKRRGRTTIARDRERERETRCLSRLDFLFF